MKLDPKPDNPCFGCGGANSRGMRLAFEQDDARQRIVGRFRLGEEYQGGSGFLHGGIIALLLDEAMGKAARFHAENRSHCGIARGVQEADPREHGDCRGRICDTPRGPSAVS